ncbi:star-related lipid transfer protein 7 mitochondrial [Phtheirospermum japonicum]|uniref:Star-related lipid transfer protein 7 mitochondrial n=1 Tax=Phtheirospermum japonicum TaxID=374723 RepID=A0A830C302_9LAMI|nr:star-related lipid transfer protein 7 mitochondrial [Phtheirospermum japonicum]
MALISAFLEILRRPTTGDVMYELMKFMAPIWVAVLVGILVGWAWKPKWAILNVDFLDNNPNKGETKTTSKSVMLFPQFASSIPSLSSLKQQLPTWIFDYAAFDKDNSTSPSASCPDNYSSSKSENEKSSVVNEDDLRHLHKLVEEKDEGPAWIKMMDKSTSGMSYQAWRRDPEIGPPQYRSRTIYEDATPEMLRDFFWDDEFRIKWDDMLIHAETLEECPNTGTMVVQWVRKFPFFCSDREYIIGRRIWESGRTYYCITKGVPCSSVPRRSKPRRVDLYYSSWCIRAAESKRDGQLTACEVLLFHHEDMGIPWEIAKLGIRQGMWGAVKKIDPGLRAYQKHRASGPPLSRSALMAQINTKVSVDTLDKEEEEAPASTCGGTSEIEAIVSEEDKMASSGRGIPKMLVFGGAVALACTLDRGLLTKAVIFGVARRFAKMGKRL